MENFQRQFVLAMLGYATQRGLQAQELCSLSAIPYKVLVKDKHYPVTSGQVNALWKNAAHLGNDRLFGLHFGESMQLAALGVIGQLVQTSSTVGEALSHAAAMTHLVTDIFHLHVSQTGNQCKVTLLPVQKQAARFPHSFRHMADYLMVFILHELDGLCLQQIIPQRVAFAYKVEDENEYTRVFRCIPQKRIAECSITFARSILEEPVLSANYMLQQQLLKQVSSLVNKGEVSQLLSARIHHYLLTHSYLAMPAIDSVAANFNMSARTLQRKLKGEGVSFIEITDHARKALATSYLNAGNHAVKDIAHILGYNDQSAFFRAFKRWTGKTPASFLQETTKETGRN